jgi:hypothetical protein
MENTNIAKNSPDYLEKVFRAIEEANREMHRYNIELVWSFKLDEYRRPKEKALPL